MIDVSCAVRLQTETVARWHQQAIDNPYDGIYALVCKQHSFNFLLWHEEDIARSPDVPDKRIAEVKRAIDRYNQQRNDWIEKLDDWFTGQLGELRVAAALDAPLNTETPGSVLDRLSILALRIYHLEEQRDRQEVDSAHRDAVSAKLAICLAQQADLAQSLTELLADIRAGRKRHRTYRQLKMYNDPALNPYLYQAQQRRAG
jgi:hypothetical protein